MRKSLTLAAAMACLGALALPVTASASPEGSAVVARGHAATGARVLLYAWPARAADLGLGHRADRVLLATATAGARGNYRLRVPLRRLTALTGNSGYASLEADAGSSSRFFVWHATWTPVNAATVASPATVNLPARPGTCGPWVLKKKFNPVPAIVGQTYVLRGASHVDQGFTYLKGQESSIGIRPSLNGSDFEADGTVALAAPASIAFPSSSQETNNLYQTMVRMGEYEQTCFSPAGPVKMIRPIGFAGGQHIQHPAKAPAASACRSLRKGSTFATGKQKAITWPDGLTLDGMPFSMQTGYDRSAQVTYKFGAPHRLCGTGKHGVAASPVYVVKP
jgi:hypothetical protein